MAQARIAVLGPGGVGGFIAAALAHAGERVTVVARTPTAEAIARTGIAIRSAALGDFHVAAEAVAELTVPVEILVVATKATSLPAALARVREPPELVVPLLNGIEHMAVLRKRFGPGRVIAASIRIEADRRAPGEIVQMSPSVRIDLASDDRALQPRLGPLAERLRRAGVPVQIERSEAQALWSKLVRLNALACTTAASDRPIGFIRADHEWRAALESCVTETAAVARAAGADVDADDRLAELLDAHPELGSSMRRDIAAGREPELDAIAGAVLRAARRHGLECPTVARLAVVIAARAGIAPPQV